MQDKLIRMANQIAQFFRNQKDMPPPEAVAAHINDFWSYQMRSDLLAQLGPDSGADPIVEAARDFIRLPGSLSQAE